MSDKIYIVKGTIELGKGKSFTEGDEVTAKQLKFNKDEITRFVGIGTLVEKTTLSVVKKTEAVEALEAANAELTADVESAQARIGDLEKDNADLQAKLDEATETIAELTPGE